MFASLAAGDARRRANRRPAERRAHGSAAAAGTAAAATAGVAACELALTPGAGALDFSPAAAGAWDGDFDCSGGMRMIEAGGKPLESGFGKRGGVCARAAPPQHIAMHMQTAMRRSIGFPRWIPGETTARP